VLHRAPHLSWWERLTGLGDNGYTFQIHPRDEAGARALRDLEGHGVNVAANALAQSVDHVLSFFRMMRAELAFYLGCMNLHGRLARKDEPMCLPDPRPVDAPALIARGLYDACLSLRIDSRVVGNDIDADGRNLVMITGANEGGKSTFLRSVGVAQLMMQSGMFVPATSFAANATTGVFTHFKREEDATMTHGKLDEELARMSQIADRIRPGALLLCNESFASTNEREGSEIARQVVRAATESGVKVVFVTHLYDLAHDLFLRRGDTQLFLRAERQPDGRRTFRIVVGEPLPTSYGADSYRRVFAAA
jgi:DNA mismatch repair ATPase MutS